MWGTLTTLERIDLLLRVANPRKSQTPKELLAKALDDQNPVIRMLAANGACVSSRDDPELYAKLRADPSPFVRATIEDGAGASFDVAHMRSISQVERLGIIALSSSISEESFAEFIVGGLQSQTISENEAAELVTEFVRNPNLIACGIDDLEGDEVHWIKKNREKVWNLATCTPYGVHFWIAWEYPLETGLFLNISDEMLDRMGEKTLEVLAFRQYWPLLRRLQAVPEKFAKKVHDAAKFGAEDVEFRAKQTEKSRSQLHKFREELEQFRAEMRQRLDGPIAAGESGLEAGGLRGELNGLRKEFTELRTEMRELFEALARRIAEGAPRRRGFFR